MENFWQSEIFKPLIQFLSTFHRGMRLQLSHHIIEDELGLYVSSPKNSTF